MNFKDDAKKRKKFGAFLKNKRESFGYTVRDVAQMVSIPFGVYASIERGEVAKIRISMLDALAAIYETPSDELFLMCERIPPAVFYKIIRCPELLEVIRKWKE